MQGKKIIKSDPAGKEDAKNNNDIQDKKQSKKQDEISVMDGITLFIEFTAGIIKKQTLFTR